MHDQPHTIADPRSRFLVPDGCTAGGLDTPTHRCYVADGDGRKTGTQRKTRVTLVEEGTEKWLVAPYGPVSWVLNARAAGRVTLRRGKHAGVYAVREIPAAEAGPVLKKYVAIAGATRSYFKATKDSPVAEFVAEAAVHSVFELTPAGDIPDTGKNQLSRAGDREGQRGRAHRPGMHVISRSDASPPRTRRGVPPTGFGSWSGNS